MSASLWQFPRSAALLKDGSTDLDVQIGQAGHTFFFKVRLVKDLSAVIYHWCQDQQIFEFNNLQEFHHAFIPCPLENKTALRPLKGLQGCVARCCGC